MKKITKITILTVILLFFGGSGFVFYIFHSTFWKNIATSYIQRQLSSRYNLALSITELSGSPFGHIRVRGIQLTTEQNHEILTIDEISLRYGLVHFLFEKGKVSYLGIHSPQLRYPASIDTLKKYMTTDRPQARSTSLFFKTVELTNIRVSSSDSVGSELATSDYIVGDFGLFPDSLAMSIQSGNVGFTFLENDVVFGKTHLSLISDSLVIQECRLLNESMSLDFFGYALLNSTIYMELDNRIENLVFRERFMQEDTTVFAVDDYLDLEGKLIVLGSNVRTDYRFSGVLRGNVISDGIIQGFIRSGYFDYNDISFRAGDQKVSTSLRGDLFNGIRAEMSINQLDLLDWELIDTHTLLNGRLALSSVGTVFDPDTILAELFLSEIRFDTLQIDSVNGLLRYAEGNVEIIDTAFVRFEKTAIKAEGSCNLDSNTVNSRLYFLSDSMDVLADLMRVRGLQGRLNGFLEVTGRLSNPDFRGWLRGANFGTSQLYFEETIARFGLMNFRDQQFGDIYIEATNGNTPLLKEPIPLTSMIIRFEGDTSRVHSLRMVGENFNFEVQGKIIKFAELIFDKIDMYYEGNSLKNIDPIYISLKEDTVRLAEVRFDLNEGMLIASGTSVNKRIHSAVVNIRDLDINPINAYLKGARGVEGVLNGLFTYADTAKTPAIYSRIEIGEANLIGKPFNNIRLESRLSDNQITLENLLLEDAEKGYINGFGALNCHYPIPDSGAFFNPADLINVQLQFDNFDFGTIGSFVMKRLPKDGKLFGSFIVGNTIGSPVISYDLNLKDPVLDRLSGQELQAKGMYHDSKLEFTNLHLRDQYGISRGSGYLPLNVSFQPLHAVFERDSSMYMNFTIHSTAVEFLSLYIPTIESIEGEYDLALSISGTPRNPTRSGNVIAKNGIIRISSLENPVTGVTGSAVMTNNVLEIVSLEGFMLRPLSGRWFDRFKRNLKKYTMDILFPPKKLSDEPNISISGNLDMTTFFRPVFNIQLEGEEMYIRTLLAEQEGILDGTFSMVGGDTITIEGEVDIYEFIIRNEFQRAEPLFEVEDTRRRKRYTTINLHTIVPGNLYLRNSQLDCELEGEMWIIRNGPEPYRFSGTLDIRKGKFYYYGWEFEVVQGSISFDPTEFNPTLDIEARVDLASYAAQNSTETVSSDEDDYVTVFLSGDLQNPTLVFDSRKWNESDILMLLSRTQLGTDDPLNQESMTDGAKNIFEMYFERQLEKRIGQISGLDEFELRTSGDLFSSNQQPDQWSVSLGQKLAPNLYIKYERSLSQNPDQMYGVEYRLSRNFSVSGELDQNGSFRINYLYKYRY